MHETPMTYRLFAADEPELVRAPAAHYLPGLGTVVPGTDDFYRKKALIADLARALTGEATPVVEIQYWYPDRTHLRRSGPHHEIRLDAFTHEMPQDTLRTILRDRVA
ncbi:hypothetical protein [Glycomyces salinus]|uniref:hypothetical protein n=1 Tax=Glycomyces salinus TaxID=980294 RepID=UPI0018EAE28A|nr:hypothetical protein [Glycomyces salinus]